MTEPTLKIQSLSDQPLPYYATAGASGLDLPASATVRIEGNGAAMISTGIAIELPPGYEGQIRARSSTYRLGLLVIVGTIDNDYRRELGIVVVNLTGSPVTVQRGQCIAQLVIAPVARVKVIEVQTIADNGRGGFGSTNAGR
jgi:dUTP pyrophosphatase